MIYKKRLKKLFRKLGKNTQAVLICGDASLLAFLTGHGEGGAVATPRGVEFVVPKMLTEAAEETGMKVHVHGKRGEYRKMLRTLLSRSRTIGLRSSAVSHALFLDLKKMLRGFKLVDISAELTEIFIRKDREEIDLLRKACTYTARAARLVPSMLKRGMTEIDLMREISYSMKAIGGGMVSFGENTSRPHHQPGHRKLKKGDLVMVDFGCRVSGVGSDITRTFCFGRASKEQKDLYIEVRRAQGMAFDMLKERDGLADINKAVSEMFQSDGYGPFIHSIGHSLGYGGAFRNVENNVVTIEPGIYIPGFGGVRIEDDMLITKDGFENLTKLAPAKELIEV